MLFHFFKLVNVYICGEKCLFSLGHWVKCWEAFEIEDECRQGRASTSITDDNVQRVLKSLLGSRIITEKEIATEISSRIS